MQYAERSEEILEGVTATERVAWYNHECTKALLFAIDADVAGILALWIQGGYAKDDSIDSTAQAQAKARGMAQALSDIREFIEDIKDNREPEEVDSGS